MARRSSRTASASPGDGRIVDIDVSDEMRSSFLEYAYSVIYARALPDARDGLKPVQRRILFQMAQMGLRPDRGHVKSARVVGEVMGRLHPHGDTAIYDALVRMAQSFSLRLPMVDGHGNFGSPDDGPAAMRYTEARLAAAALSMTASLDEDVVDFSPNYDGRETEPAVLPADGCVRIRPDARPLAEERAEQQRQRDGEGRQEWRQAGQGCCAEGRRTLNATAEHQATRPGEAGSEEAAGGNPLAEQRGKGRGDEVVW